MKAVLIITIITTQWTTTINEPVQDMEFCQDIGEHVVRIIRMEKKTTGVDDVKIRFKCETIDE